MQKKKLYLSNSSIRTFVTCKKRFKYKHIDKLDTGANIVSKHMSFGNSMHQTLADFNLLRDKRYRTLEVLHKLFRKNWIRDGYSSIEEERDFGLRGLDMLTHYFNNPLDQGKQNIIIEEMIFREEDNFILCGKLDKVYQRTDGIVEIVDYKTGNTVTPIDQLQLPIYLVLAQSKLGYYPTAISLYFLSQAKKVCQEVDQSFIDESIRYINDLCNQIGKETKHEPSPNSYCRMNCEYHAMCDEAKDQNLIVLSKVKQLKTMQEADTVF